jgi:hypothetical protein
MMVYQIVLKVPKDKQNLKPNEILQKFREINPRVGEISFENDQFFGFGFNQETDDISDFTVFSRKANQLNLGNTLTFRMESPNPVPGFKKPSKYTLQAEVLVVPCDRATPTR